MNWVVEEYLDQLLGDPFVHFSKPGFGRRLPAGSEAAAEWLSDRAVPKSKARTIVSEPVATKRFGDVDLILRMTCLMDTVTAPPILTCPHYIIDLVSNLLQNNVPITQLPVLQPRKHD